MLISRRLGAALSVSICVLAALECAQAQPAPTGSVRGTVTSDKGKALVAVVTAAKITATAASGRTQSAPNGSFGFDNLPVGDYLLCVQVPAGGFVDPCHWSPAPQTVTVKSGQTTAGLQIRVATASVLQIRLNDPGDLLQPKGGVAPHIMMGVVTSRGLFQPAFLAVKDAAGQDHQVTVPLDTPLKFSIFSKHVQLTDANGQAVDSAGSSFTFQHTTGAAQQKTFTYNVVAAISQK